MLFFWAAEFLDGEREREGGGRGERGERVRKGNENIQKTSYHITRIIRNRYSYIQTALSTISISIYLFTIYLLSLTTYLFAIYLPTISN